MRARNLPVFCALFVLVRCNLRRDQAFWKELANNELTEALSVQWNLNTAKNVILFVGDGMGPNTVTATRIYKGGETHRLVYEKFPHVGLLKTYSADKMVPDSSCTATALFCGVKTNEAVLGLDATVVRRDCAASLRAGSRLESLAALALKAGKSAGFVTTMRVTHATPAPLYAHSPDRSWECEANLPPGSEACKDIARQLVEDWPGRDLQVVLGGGRQTLVSNVTGSAADPLDTWSCRRMDGRNLIRSYTQDKEQRGLKYRYVTTSKELAEIGDDTDYLFGIFANGHLKYEFERDRGPEGTPSLADMTEAAIKVLQKNTNGYFLMVEGGNVDMAHHRGRARTAVDESAAFEEAVRVAAAGTLPGDTLIVVTADHTHTLTINGYQDRGSDIFGIAQPSPFDGTNYTTLSYGTGGPGSMHYYVHEREGRHEVKRTDASTQDTGSFYYEQVAAVTLDENSHGGGDVAVYARGPYAHLFHNVHEQHYLFHAVSFAAKYGEYNDNSAHITENMMMMTMFVFVIFHCILA